MKNFLEESSVEVQMRLHKAVGLKVDGLSPTRGDEVMIKIAFGNDGTFTSGKMRLFIGQKTCQINAM
jgi:hypothetical protein